MNKIPWRTGVNMREFAYYTRPDLIEFVSTDPQRNRLRTLQQQQLDALKTMRVKLVRFFASHHALSFGDNISQVHSALDLIQQAGMQAVVCLTDSLGSRYTIPGDEPYHTEDMGHLHKRYWRERLYRQNYLRYLNELSTALRGHPAGIIWELGNEFAIHPRFAGPEDTEAFLEFVREASIAIKHNIPTALVSTGLINTNQIVQGGSPQDRLNYSRRLHGLSSIDLVSLHVYAQDDEDTLALIDVEAARMLDKPFYIGELGQRFTGGDRSGYYQGEINRWRQRGAMSVMPWQFDTSDIDCGVGDLLGVAKMHSDFEALKRTISDAGVDAEPIIIRINDHPIGEVPSNPQGNGGETTPVGGNVVEPFWMLPPVRWEYTIRQHFDDPANYSASPNRVQRREGMLFVPSKPNQTLEVCAVQRGVVDRIGYFGAGYGNFVVVTHEWNGDTYVSWYGHLARVDVRQSQHLSAGDVIGIAGNTGSASEICLFLTLQHIGKGKANYIVADVIDPEPLFRTSVALRDEAAWDADVTIEDGSIYAPSALFKKIWRVRNIGTTTWDTRYVLAFHSGNSFGTGSAVPLTVSVAPGATAMLAVDMVVPETPGVYRSQWMLRNAQGQFFPHELYTEIIVRDPNKAVGVSLARFVDDVTVRDGMIVTPGQNFTKTWRILNDGETTWGEGYVLAHFAHERMGAPEHVALPPLRPHQQGNVSVDLTAPTTPGLYRTTWKPHDANGKLFDFEMYAEINVQSQVTNTVQRFDSPVKGVYRIGLGYLDHVNYLDGTHKGVDYLSMSAQEQGHRIEAGGNGVVYRSKRCTECSSNNPNFITHQLDAAQQSAAFSDWKHWSWGFGHLVIVRYAWNDLPVNARTVMTALGFPNWFAFVYYAHLSELLVAQDANVTAGQQIGRLGTTGNSTWPHLHLEVRLAPTPTNDMAFPGGRTAADRYRRIDPKAMFNT